MHFRKNTLRFIAAATVFLPLLYNACGSSFKTTENSLSESNAPNTQTPNPTPMRSVLLAVGTGGLRSLSSDGFATFDSKTYDVAGTLNLAAPPQCVDNASQIIGNRCCYQDQWSCYAGNGHSDFHLRDVAYGQGKFVAVGGAAFGISRTSTDGITWSNRSLWINGNTFIKQGVRNPSFITSILYHQGEFIAMAGFGALLYHSVDGTNWYNESTDLGGVFGNLIFTGAGFFATGQNGGWAFSTDGKTWTAHASHPDKLRLYDPVSNGQIVLVREAYTNGQTQFIRKNADNSNNWSYGEALPVNISRLIYSPQTQKFYAYSTGKVYLSSDGSQWQMQSLNGNFSFQEMFYNNGFYFAQDYNWQTAESKIYRSNDGINWTIISNDPPGQGQKISVFYQADIY